MVEGFDSPDIWAPFGAFSMAVIQGRGQIVWLKGQVALDKAGKLVGPGDMQAQLRQVLENLKAVLANLGGEMGDMISLTHYTTDIDQFMAASDLRRGYFTPPYPVTTTVQVARLYDPELLIEIAGVAEIPVERFRRPVR
ncbi:MAG TPA: RidA family protein [Verrucomicrobiae bacterium]|jgi:2-iminobutanoate/2-iminopropanoate deaminase|nr:RidA family protein [Verrucomicrobiae bacterium]